MTTRPPLRTAKEVFPTYFERSYLFHPLPGFDFLKMKAFPFPNLMTSTRREFVSYPRSRHAENKTLLLVALLYRT